MLQDTYDLDLRDVAAGRVAYKGKVFQVSISPAFYAQLFRIKVLCEAFLYLIFRFVLL